MSKLLWLLSFLAFISLFGARYALGQWNVYLWVPLVLLLITFSLAVWLDRSQLKSLLFARRTKFGLNTLTLILIALGFLAGLNFLIYKNNQTFDFSKEQNLSLSPQTKKVLDDLSKVVTFEVFYSAQDQSRREDFYRLMLLFQDQSDKIEVNYKDPALYPDLVKTYSITNSGTVIVKTDGKQSRIQDSLQPFNATPKSSITEEQIVNQIIKLQRKEEIEICFTQGHKEKSFEGQGALAINDFKNSLDNLSYVQRTLRLIEEKQVPDSCKLLAILGPELAFEEEELEKVIAYLKDGKPLLLAIDPGFRHNMARLTKLFGVSFTNLYLVDYEGQLTGQNAALTVGRDYNPDHEITKSFNNNMYSFFPVASFFEVENKDDKIRELFYSSSQSFTQPDLSSNPQVVEGRDRFGPLPIAIAAEKKVLDSDKVAKAVMIADSDFIVDQFYQKFINKDILLNSIGYLTDEANLVSIRKEKSQDLLLLTQTKANVMALIFFSIPVMMLFGSIMLWIRK